MSFEKKKFHEITRYFYQHSFLCGSYASTYIMCNFVSSLGSLWGETSMKCAIVRNLRRICFWMKHESNSNRWPVGFRYIISMQVQAYFITCNWPCLLNSDWEKGGSLVSIYLLPAPLSWPSSRPEFELNHVLIVVHTPFFIRTEWLTRSNIVIVVA